MASISQLKLPDNTIYNIKGSIHNVIGTQTASTNSWTGNLTSIDALYDGLTIAYYLPYEGSGKVSLNLTLKNNVTTGAINCYLNNDTQITTQYKDGSIVCLTYFSAGSISIDGTPTTSARWVAQMGYEMVILSYGSSTWNDFIVAYNTNSLVYCRASSNSNPASGSKTRLAFMAYVNNEDNPTEVEFQYYRSVATHTNTQQGDQVYVYKLNKTNGWSVTVREAYTKIIAGAGLSSSYSNNAITLTASTTAASEMPADIDTTGAIGISTNYARQDHTHKISLATGDENGQIKIAGTNISVKGLGSNAYTSTEYAPLASPALTGVPTAPTAENGTNSTQIATTAFVNNIITNLPTPMQFIGTVGTDGTVTWANLATAATANTGYTYKVITDHTAETGKPAAKSGDTIISNGTEWIVVPSGDEPSGTVTSVTLKAGTGISLDVDNTAITSSGTRTIGLASAYGDSKNPYGTKTANYVLAGPTSGTATAPSFRKLVAADIPDLSNTYLTSYTETDPTVPSWAKASSKPSYTASEVGAAASSHAHGNITSDGDMTTNVAIASGDRLVINDESASKLNSSSITFGSSTTQYLSNKGTWENLPQNISYIAGTGLSLSGTTFNHSNSITAQTTQALYPIKIDAQGHISAYGSAVTVPTITDTYSATSSNGMSGKAVASALSNSGFISSETDPIFSASAAAGITSSNITSWNNKANSDHTHSYAASSSVNGNANQTNAILYGTVDDTSTSTAFTATISGLTELIDGTAIMLHNGVVTSAAGFTININNLGAKKCYNNMTNATQDSTIFNIAYTFLFIYSSTLDSGNGGWWIYRGYNSDNNTIGYQLRTNSTVMPTITRTRYYRLLFTSADHTKWVPANTEYDNSATSKKTVNQNAIDPHGRIVYMSGTTNVNANVNVGATVCWDQYTLNLGYSFNTTTSALEMIYPAPVFVKCAPQNNGSAIIDSTTPIVQALPSVADDKIYIYLGMAYSATNIELVPNHPIYEYKDGAIRLWTNAGITTHTHNEYINQNAFSNVKVGSTTVAADSITDTLELAAGDNITLTPDITNDKVTIAAIDTTYENKAATSGGTAISLVTTGEKYIWNNKSDTDTLNTAGSTDSSSKLFLIGATSQAANPQTYSQDTAYIGTDGHLYSNSIQVVNLSGSQALTNKTYNGYTLAAACAKGVDTSISSTSSTNLPTTAAVTAYADDIIVIDENEPTSALTKIWIKI